MRWRFRNHGEGTRRSRRPILSTLAADGDEDWNREVRAVRPVGRAGGLRDLSRLWRLSGDREALVLQGSSPASQLYRDLVLAMLVKVRRRRPHILLTDATWELGSQALARRAPWIAPLLPTAMRLFIRLIDGPHVTYGVLSTEELRTFPRTWRIPAARVVFLEFAHTLWGESLDVPVSDGGYLFAGGNSLRDYDLLADAVAGCSFATRVAASWQATREVPGLSASSVPHQEYVALLAAARAVVVPLRSSIRSAGQQTYLNAMALGKPVVVTDAPGVRDYIRHGVNGWIAGPTPSELREQLDYVMDPANATAVAAVAEEGRRETLDRWTDYTYRAQLLRLARAGKPAT